MKAIAFFDEFRGDINDISQWFSGCPWHQTAAGDSISGGSPDGFKYGKLRIPV